ncbi:MAG: polyribonucleotide nucleotidyltransferase [Proteobacteria bacterium]|nr:polyribonucleotide nucleotidyltransferase [Pseudomonadota bacterium]
MATKVEVEFWGRKLSIETGHLAKQANGSALVTYGDTVVLVTAVSNKEPKKGIDFFPLTVNYQEKTFAAGKIPGGFFKREGRPSEKETLTSRLIDRPLRPLFQKGFCNETQIIATVLSLEPDCDPDMVAMVGASAALEVSNIPFHGPIASVRVGRVDEKFIINPTVEQLEKSDIDLIVAGSREAVMMVEGGGKVIPDEIMLEAVLFGHDAITPLLDMQDELKSLCGNPVKMEVHLEEANEELDQKVAVFAEAKITEALRISSKAERYEALAQIKNITISEFGEEGNDDLKKEIASVVDSIKKKTMRNFIIKDQVRIDGRGTTDVRSISCEVGALPRTHGSAVFTRGETQALAVTTLGTTSDKQIIDALMGGYKKDFMLHYNFPPFCVGEASFLKSPGRREIGHGALAERALFNVKPSSDEFPYTIRIVSEVLESNGSSSMASVCGGSLSMMDAGVPLKSAVAGIAMGLIKEGDDIAILSDILGDEDHLGDMDFKVAGTTEGVTALQMDIKITGVTKEIMEKAILQAREGRLYILKEMGKALIKPREELSTFAPKIVTLYINKDKIRDLIGPGGKNIKMIVETTGAQINVNDDGRVEVASSNDEMSKMAIKKVRDLTQDAEVGRLYLGTVRKIMDFGAFVEIYPGTDGLVHISELAEERVKSVTDILNEGDEVLVKVLDIDRQGKIKLSRKEALGQSLAS